MHLHIQQQQGLPQPVVLNEIDILMPNDHVEITEPPALNQELLQGSKHELFVSAIDHLR